MRITIAERLKPFSHCPGTAFVLPWSAASLEIFPGLIRVRDISGALPQNVAEIPLDIKGPVKGFTVIQDLEKGMITVFGNSVDGYFRYFLKVTDDGHGIALRAEKGTSLMNASQTLALSQVICHPSSVYERLSLGNSKKQDWELVKRRLSFAEIFPVWHHLGQMVCQPQSGDLAGTSLLLRDCQDAIAANAPEKILSQFEKVFLAGFDGVLSPRLIDTDHQGIQSGMVALDNENQASAMTLLTEGAKLIRSLFVRENENEIHILPAIPPEFHCGRFLNVKCGKQGILSFEWTKKSIRRMTFHAAANQNMAFFFSNHEKKCRLRTSNKDKGIVYQPGAQLAVVAGQEYWFDNFER